jgi:hypothetical protein
MPKTSCAIAARVCLAVSGAAMIPTANVFATDLGSAGGSGGAPFRFTCPTGSYIAGFTGSAGDYIDRMSPLCARWNPQTRNLDTPSQATHYIGQSTGGRPLAAYCPSDTVANFIGFTVLRSDNHLVDQMYFTCKNPSTGGLIGLDANLTFSGTGQTKIEPFSPDDVAPHHYEFTCPSGELATGLMGRSGSFIDALGLICGPAPKAHVTIATPTTSGGVAPVAQAFPKPSTWSAAPGGVNQATPGLTAGGFHLTPVPQSIGPQAGPSPQVGPSAGVPSGNQVHYNFPYINDYDLKWGPLEWCKTPGKHCGAPTAAAYCQKVDAGAHPQVADFKRLDSAAAPQTTIAISNREHCTASSCAAFEYIVCKS